MTSFDLTTHADSAPPFADAHVADAMHHGVLTCPPNTPLRTVARMMAQYRVHAVVVTEMDDEGDGERAWRVVSDVGLVRHAAHSDDVTAGGASTEAPVVVDPEDPLRRAAQLMSEHGTSHVIVVDSGGRPVGIVSALDIARMVSARR